VYLISYSENARTKEGKSGKEEAWQKTENVAFFERNEEGGNCGARGGIRIVRRYVLF
jgi:hypothetical protein